MLDLSDPDLSLTFRRNLKKEARFRGLLVSSYCYFDLGGDVGVRRGLCSTVVVDLWVFAYDSLTNCPEIALR